MLSTALRQANHVHKPLIRFIGKRVHDQQPSPPGPHPLAPSDIKDKFGAFLEQQSHPLPSQTQTQSNPSSSSSAASQSTPRVVFYEDASELPWSYRKPSTEEIELVNGGGIMR